MSSPVLGVCLSNSQFVSLDVALVMAPQVMILVLPGRTVYWRRGKLVCNLLF